MQNKSKSAARLFAVTGAVMVWTALLLQLYLILENRNESISETLIRYFTFFTILCNILAAICFTSLALPSAPGRTKFFSRAQVITAVAVYIVIVCFIYRFILRPRWNPQGLEKIADELLYSVDPSYFVLYWYLFVPKYPLRWSKVFSWLIFPCSYLLFILFRGAFSDYYPYSFMDVKQFGYSKVFLNCGIILVIFLFFSLLFVGIGKLTKEPSE